MLERIGSMLRAYAFADGRGYPDWAVRYLPICRQISALHLRPRTIIEIGANQNGFARFSGLRTIVTDIAIEHVREARSTQNVMPVVANATALPFKNACAELCVCVDTFEHLSPEQRRFAVAQIARVTARCGAAVIAFPTGAAAAAAEQDICRRYKTLTGSGFRWLEEHAAHGLPEAEEIFRVLCTAFPNRRIVKKRNANLRVWRWMWMILICEWPGRGNALFQALLRFATPLLTRIHFGTCYRVVLWALPVEK